jgi:PPOX class probable F420-dependent enzyme
MAKVSQLSDSEVEFLRAHRHAAMITVARDGTPKVARVAIGVVDGRVWSSGTRDRVRTRRLARDPRCSLYVQGRFPHWLTLEGRVRIIDGPDAPAANLRLTRTLLRRPEGPVTWFGEEMAEETFLRAMVEQRRLVYELTTEKTYGSLPE